MRLLVSDASALIDLNKVDLMEPFMRLPYEFMVPDVIVDELRSFNETELANLTERMTVCKFTGEEVLRVERLLVSNQGLSEPDLFALIAAENYPNSILLTGDGRLRTLATQRGQDIHGVLWVVLQIHAHLKLPKSRLLEALHFWKSDPFCRLKDRLLDETIGRI